MIGFDPAPYVDDADSIVRSLLGPSAHGLRSTRVAQIGVRPGRSVTVQYAITWDGVTRPTSLVVRAASDPTPGLEPVAVDSDGHPICAFREFEDPALPGLGRATDAQHVAHLLESLGRPVSPAELTLRLRAHRPLRRAVVEASGPSGRLFLKVVPPRKAEALHRRHRLLTDAGVPVAPSVGYSTDGIVVLGEVTGTTLREEIDSGAPLPGIGAVHRLLDRFPDEVADLPGPSPAIRRLHEHAAFFELVVPESRTRVDRILEMLDPVALERAARTEPVVPVHGDLYEAQIMASDGRVRALVDVDGIGGGQRIDDDANALGHLSLYDLVSSHDRAQRLGAAWIAHLDEHAAYDPMTLRAHVAASLFGLATGSYRVQEPGWRQHTLARLDLASAWASAGQR